MTTHFVTRHAGAVDWARRQGIEAECVPHLDPDRIARGDTVLGTLPINLIAEIGNRGARYFHLVLDLPAELRGKDLSAAELQRLGAQLVEYRAERVSP